VWKYGEFALGETAIENSLPEQERNMHMKSHLPIVVVLVLSAAVAVAQPPGGPNNFDGAQVPGGQPGQFGGPGPRMFMGPPPNAMFSAIDVDSDGIISKAELRRAVAQLRKLDTDKDGNITLAEVSVGGPGGPMGDPAQFVERLLQNDKNGDGKLTIDEVPDFMKPMLEGADANGDGAIDRNELATVAENMRNRFPGGGPGSGGFPGGPGGFRGTGGLNGRPADPNQLTGQLMQNDRNGDGKLTIDEVPPQAMTMLQGGDQNGDGAIDAAEMQVIMRRMGGRARALGPGLGPDANKDGAQGRDNAGRGRQRARNENQ
jgi:Ca2+-binding EF-hand superfamily protein